ncbi:MAG TPA: 4Fe-4S dicluster domain-containing protein [Anaerolineales bacterium]|nr:4Fe-4S dicluster domain-containing protein [Anaerolineales bacterium]
MSSEHRPEIGSTVAIQKSAFNALLNNLKEQGYEAIGPHVKNETLVYEPITALEDLPRGYVTEQEAGHFRLIYLGHSRYFDVIPGAQSWKQFLFPSRKELFSLTKNDGGWKMEEGEKGTPAYAFIGVRGCELAAIQIQDNIFLRSDFNDPIYRARRERAFILSVNCLHPAGTCFCVSMGTGPRVNSGYDLNLTELEDVFLLTIGSESGRGALTGVPLEAANGFVLNAANRALEHSASQMGRKMDTSNLPELILNHLDDPYWRSIGERCLSCANCTQVCPTCFCWDTLDTLSLDGNETRRTRVWDSCFNPGYSYQAGGNTRPTIHSRYRQWLSHKLGNWKQQFGTLGCVGCGRCITWCPAAIDITAEVVALREETSR